MNPQQLRWEESHKTSNRVISDVNEPLLRWLET